MKTQFVLASAVALLATTAPTLAADRVVASVAGSSFTIQGSTVTTVAPTFSTNEPISGVGFTGLFTAETFDEDGRAPWSLDVAATVTSPDNQSIGFGIGDGNYIGGDVTIADFPYADFTTGFNAADGNGQYEFAFVDELASGFRIGIENPTYHLLSESPDVVTPLASDVSTGPQWDRPYFIAGVSTLGPVNYDVFAFTPEVSGGYTFDSVVSQGDGFTFLYEGDFDPDAPLDNLLDYGLGNGNAPNGAADGQSLIESLLFADTTYYFVTSQFAANSGPQSYVTTVTGPGNLLAIPEPTTVTLLATATLGLLSRRRR